MNTENLMPAYWIARAKIHDRNEYRKYTDLVGDILTRYGGKVLARGGRFQVLEGREEFSRFILVEFPTFAQGAACFHSDEYNHAAAFRRANGVGEVEIVMVEGRE
jgi:uncharacterized protein (DUF1330 family)